MSSDASLKDLNKTQGEVASPCVSRSKPHDEMDTEKPFNFTLLPYDPLSPPLKKRKGTRNALQSADTIVSTHIQQQLPRHFVCSREEGNFLKVSPCLLYKDITKTLGNVKMIKKCANGTLLLEVSSDKQSIKATEIKKLGEFDVKIEPHKKLNNSQGVIYCRDLIHSSTDEILEETSQFGVTNVRRIERREGGELKPTPLVILTFNTTKAPESIKIAFYKLKVRPFIPNPLRCFRCLRFGHTSLKCKSKEEICNCGCPKHEGTECQQSQCVNCGENHSSRSPRCPVFIKEKEIQRLKVTLEISYPKARAMANGKSLVNPIKSFAEAVKNRTQNVVRKESLPKNINQESLVPEIKNPATPQKTQQHDESINKCDSGVILNNEEPPLQRNPLPKETPTSSKTWEKVMESQEWSSGSEDEFTKPKKKKGWPKGKPRKPPKEKEEPKIKADRQEISLPQ